MASRSIIIYKLYRYEKEEIKQIHEQLENNNLDENNLEKLILLIEKKERRF